MGYISGRGGRGDNIMNPDPQHRTLRCQTCNFACDKEPDGLRVFSQHVCTPGHDDEGEEQKPSKKQKKNPKSRGLCMICNKEVTTDMPRSKDVSGQYLHAECAAPYHASQNNCAAAAAAGAATSTVVPTQADWDTLFKCSFCSRRRQEGSDTCGTCWPMKR